MANSAGIYRQFSNLQIMALSNNSLRHIALRMVLVQVAFTIFIAVIFYLQQGNEFALAALYGGAVTFASTLLSAWRTEAAIEADRQHADPGMLELYQMMVMRFLLVVGLLALGLGWLKLAPIALVSGFVAAQVGQIFAPARMKRA